MELRTFVSQLPADVRSAIERARAEREAALSALTPEVRVRIELAEQLALDQVLYGASVVVDGQRVDPRTISA